MSESIDTETRTGWLAPDELETVRGLVPTVYVEAVPVRTDGQGRVSHVGLLLRVMPDGSISRAVVSGRVMHGERLRDALLRHLEKDLGTMALPRLPVGAAPFTVVEYFPDADVSGFHDPRQHAVSLAYVVPCDGVCDPSQDMLDLAWLTPEEMMDPFIRSEMTGGHDRLVQMALAHCGAIG